MRTMQDWFDAYGESHQNRFNKMVHWVCVPSIFYSLIGLLSQIPFPNEALGFSVGWVPYLHWGTVLVILGLFFYLRTSFGMSLGMLFISAAVLYLVKRLNLAYPENATLIYTAIFVIAWIGQFIGHKVEGKKPSFFDDLKFLLIGPAWLLGFIYRKIGIPY